MSSKCVVSSMMVAHTVLTSKSYIGFLLQALGFYKLWEPYEIIA